MTESEGRSLFKTLMWGFLILFGWFTFLFVSYELLTLLMAEIARVF